MVKIAVIGDIHDFWDDWDVEYFNASNYQCMLFVGDLGAWTNSEPTAKKLGALTRPALMIPGNHDACSLVQFIAELKHAKGLARVFSCGQKRRVRKLARNLGPVTLGGYSLHPFDFDNTPFAVICARPHAMGGDRIYYQPYLKREFRIHDWQSSFERMRALIDQAPDDILFLAHNGPSGLGGEPGAIWGCDFDPAKGDFGDPDLRMAIDYARDAGKRVLAVMAGHMHLRAKTTRRVRDWHQLRDGTAYINAAQVPRIVTRGQQRWHHHVRLRLQGDGLVSETVWVNEHGEERVHDSDTPAQRPE